MPLLAPYVLKSKDLTLFFFKYLEVSESNFILPAGEIWSVVIESPNKAITLAFKILPIFFFYYLFFQKKVVFLYRYFFVTNYTNQTY